MTFCPLIQLAPLQNYVSSFHSDLIVFGVKSILLLIFFLFDHNLNILKEMFKIKQYFLNQDLSVVSNCN